MTTLMTHETTTGQTERIEEQITLSKSNKANESVTAESYSTTEDYMSIHQKINKYKEQIAALKSKMEGLYNIRRIENIENEIKSKKEQLNSLKYEHNVLSNIQKNQNKAKAQFEQKYENKNEVKLLQEKLRTLKEEFKYSKDLQKSTEAKIKSQNSMILSLEEKCSKIKENIEFKKKSTAAQGNTQNSLMNEEDVNSLEEKVKYCEMQYANEEKNYKNEVARQQGQISKLSEELSLINIQLKEKEQEIRINELKLKELKKISIHNREIQNLNQQAAMRNKSIDARPISANNKDMPTQLRSKSKPVQSRTPNHYRNNRPFNIKFDNQVNTNYTNNPLPVRNLLPSIDNRGDSIKHKEKDEMLNQIENLKNELKNALRYNEKIFKKGLEHENFLNDNQIFTQGINHNSSIISNKDLFEKIDQSTINEKEKRETRDSKASYLTEDKRKPFKAFMFDK